MAVACMDLVCALATSHWRTKLIDWPVVQLRAREFEGLQRFQRGNFTFAQILEPNRDFLGWAALCFSPSQSLC